MVNIGIIGAGSIGKVHMQEFRKLENVCLAAITSNTLSSAEKSAHDFQIKKVYQGTKEMLADKDIDAVVIGVPNNWHAELAISSLKAGKHVLLEKPMGMNAEEARKIVEAQQETGNILMVAQHRRFEAVMMQVKELISQGAFGQIYYVKTGYVRRKGIPGWGSWFTKKDEAGGGALIDIGVHMLDLGMWFMEQTKPVSVFGSTYSEIGPLKRGIGPWGKPNWDGYFDVDDLAAAMVKMEDGSTLQLEVSWAAHTNTDSKPYLHIMGENGGISINGDQATFHTEVYGLQSDMNLPAQEQDEGARKRMSQHFIDCIVAGREPITTAQTGLQNNIILDAIYESSTTGHEVVINV
ncbi:Gfo/Idh/MocA family protein [Halalkalibacter oceani]|uniref:Gfo/Idh/MocA family protein n=1 Tax=Halalkalibacter oceani TaxID=1653776 RepID=UPI0033953826